MQNYFICVSIDLLTLHNDVIGMIFFVSVLYYVIFNVHIPICLFIYLFINLLVFILGNRGEILKAIDFVHTVVYPILCTIQL